MPLVPLYVLWTCIKETFSRWNNHFQGQNVSIKEFLSSLDERSRENLACQLWLKQVILQEMGNHSEMIIHSVEQTRPGSFKPQGALGSSILDEEGLKAILQVTLELVTWLQAFQELNEIQESSIIIFCIIQLFQNYLINAVRAYLEPMAQIIKVNGLHVEKERIKILNWILRPLKRMIHM